MRAWRIRNSRIGAATGAAITGFLILKDISSAAMLFTTANGFMVIFSLMRSWT
jgi:hypothetical protein